MGGLDLLQRDFARPGDQEHVSPGQGADGRLHAVGVLNPRHPAAQVQMGRQGRPAADAGQIDLDRLRTAFEGDARVAVLGPLAAGGHDIQIQRAGRTLAGQGQRDRLLAPRRLPPAGAEHFLARGVLDVHVILRARRALQTKGQGRLRRAGLRR